MAIDGMKHPTNQKGQQLDRRSFLQGAAGLAVSLGTCPAWGGQQRLVVMTSYPQEMISLFTDAFAALHPDIRIDFVWHTGHDAQDFLMGEGGGQVDVYWASSTRAFRELTQAGVFTPLDVDRAGLPSRIGDQEISDPNGHFIATELAGFGFAYNAATLAAAHLAFPKDWQDLADPGYAGRLLFPNPSHDGFAQNVAEALFQNEGWENGWRLLAQIGANATLYDGKGDAIVETMLRTGKDIVVTLDLFATAAIAQGQPLHFVYPPITAYKPAGIAIPKGCPNPAAAKTFVAFVLSEAGQRLLTGPALHRLPARPSVYADLGPDYFNPWSHSTQHPTRFAEAVLTERAELDDALFEQFIAEPHARIVEIRARLRQALAGNSLNQKHQARLQAALAALTTVPMAEVQANLSQALFKGTRRQPRPDKAQAEAIRERWRQHMEQVLAQAEAALVYGAPS